MPSLGTATSSNEEVLAFYEFWHNFKSWREFDAGEEGKDVDNADSRDEKRWMERENRKITKKLKKEEYSRLVGLVVIAEKYDPRIIRMRKEEEEEKTRKKEQRKAAKQARKDEAEREIREEQEKKEAAIREAEQQVRSSSFVRTTLILLSSAFRRSLTLPRTSLHRIRISARSALCCERLAEQHVMPTTSLLLRTPSVLKTNTLSTSAASWTCPR